MNGYVVLCGNVFALFSFLLCIPNVFCLLKSQFFRFFKLIQSMLHVAFSANVFKITSAIVCFATIFMVNKTIRRPISEKRLGYQTMDSFVVINFFGAQRNKHIPVASARRLKNTLHRFVSVASKYFAHYRLANPHMWGYFSAAEALFVKLPNQIKLIFSQAPLRKIWAVCASYAAEVANFVMPVKIWYCSPNLHLKTPNS